MSHKQWGMENRRFPAQYKYLGSHTLLFFYFQNLNTHLHDRTPFHQSVCH